MHIQSINLPEKQYSIFIENGLLPQIGKYVCDKHSSSKIAVVTDATVDALHGQTMIDSFSSHGFSVKKIVIPPGESSKSLAMLEYLYNEFLDYRLSRSDLIVAFGGGVVGDLVGFAAATFLRGVRYIQIPTTLLAQIDSSIGGKVAVNLPDGKNLVGTFYHPEAVFIDPFLLATLPTKILRDGIAEVIKYGAIKAPSLFYALAGYRDEQELLVNVSAIIADCCHIKQTIVEADEKDTGVRMLLNFGHTIGHAIEHYFQYKKYTHGEAVAIGMAVITQRSEALGITKPGTAHTLSSVIKKYGLPVTATEWNRESLLETIHVDKKITNNRLPLILLEGIGKASIHRISDDAIQLYVPDVS